MRVDGQVFRQIALDANVLLLWVVGTYRRSLIPQHKRTRMFQASDWQRLQGVVASRHQIILTHGVLVETSNLLAMSAGSRVMPLRQVLEQLVHKCEELTQPGIVLMQDPVYPRLGLTDAGLAGLDPACLLVSVDLELIAERWQRGWPAVNFRHLPELPTEATR